MKSIADKVVIGRKNRVGPGIDWSLVITVAVLLLVCAIFPVHAMARGSRFVLDFGNSSIQGRMSDPAVLYLKRELIRQYPEVDVTALRLRKIILVAKTKNGKGMAQLRVGPEVTDFFQVAGRSRDFTSNNIHTFNQISIHNPFKQSWGPWLLYLKGKFKVLQVVLVVEQRHREQYSKWNKKQVERPGIRPFSFNNRWD